MEIDLDLDPYSSFLFAMRSPKTKEKVVGRLRMFFDFIEVIGADMEERSKIFVNEAKLDQKWAFTCIIRYLQFLKERFEKKEIKDSKTWYDREKDESTY